MFQALKRPRQGFTFGVPVDICVTNSHAGITEVFLSEKCDITDVK